MQRNLNPPKSNIFFTMPKEPHTPLPPKKPVLKRRGFLLGLLAVPWMAFVRKTQRFKGEKNSKSERRLYEEGKHLAG